MKKKQLIAIIITGAVIIAVGMAGILSNVVANKMLEGSAEKTSSVIEEWIKNGADSTITLPEGEFIGVLNIIGDIQGSPSVSLSSSDSYDHERYMEYIDRMEQSNNNKGILLYVDSPGGTVYHADEMYLRLMEYKEETGRPIWAYFASEACSGGYYISMAADKIYANRNCWTGSIGVIVSMVNCKDLYDKLGIKEVDITSGKNKAMGSSGLDMTDEQRGILQSLVDEAYGQFVSIVSEGRKMDDKTVRKLADGRIYSAQQAKENLLIDEIGQLEEAKEAMAKETGCDPGINFFTPENDMGSFFHAIWGAAEKLVPRSDTELAADIIENKGNGVLKYYAE